MATKKPMFYTFKSNNLAYITKKTKQQWKTIKKT
jgi:hypothetical protein